MTRSREGGDDVRIVYVTAADEAEGARIARVLVGESLAACVNIVPGVRSVYRWEGAIEEAEEAMLAIKTTAGRLEALDRRVRELHSYDLPEVVAVTVAGGSDAYLGWVRRSVGGGGLSAGEE